MKVNAAAGREIALVAMPWALFNRPSIQLGALKAFIVREGGAGVVCLHPYLEIAAALGVEAYRTISLDGWSGEALYAPLVLPERTDAARRFYGGRLPSGPDFDRTRAVVAARLEHFVNAVAWERFSLVGFSVCFFQLLPTLAAARMIRERAPGTRIVLGGSLFSPATAAALRRNFPVIDQVICGEGEAALLSLCRGEDRGVPGVGQLPIASLPRPDFDDYFRQLSTCFSGAAFVPEIPLEFSRGCWWNRCRFCNLNLQWQGYRRFTAVEVFRRVMAESARGCLDFTFTDNVLPKDEAGRFFDLTAESGRDFSFFAEIRAGQRGELGRYRRGGLREIQVGIEAFSDSLLKKMAKGTSVLANLAVMKKAKQCGVRLSGNLICEFPGSTAAEVKETLAVIELARPYDPLDPAGFFLGDGSPLAADPAACGITAVIPHPAYVALLGRGLARDLALPVRGYRGDIGRQKKMWKPVRAAIAAWRKTCQRRGRRGCALSLRDGGGFIIVRRELDNGEVMIHRLRGLSREIYLAGDELCGIEKLLASRPELTAERLRPFLKEMEEKKLLCSRGGEFLSLAVRPSKSTVDQGGGLK